jgi:hypothetical protein
MFFIYSTVGIMKNIKPHFYTDDVSKIADVLYCNFFDTFPCAGDSASEDTWLMMTKDQGKNKRMTHRTTTTLQRNEAESQAKKPHRQRLVLVRNLGPLKLPESANKPANLMLRRLSLQLSLLRGPAAPERLLKKRSKNLRKKGELVVLNADDDEGDEFSGDEEDESDYEGTQTKRGRKSIKQR